MLAEARYFARMMGGCRSFVQTPPVTDPRTLLAGNLARREENFLEVMRRVVFANPANPYFKLFQWAGYGLEDVSAAVRRDGLDAALAGLHKSGVYLSHDEFKGKKPIERTGLVIETQPRDFANPLVRGALETTSSGSRSRGTVTRPSVEFQVYREAQDSLFVGQFEPSKKAIGAVLPILPSTVGFNRMMTFARRGTPVEKWFALGGSWKDSGHYRLVMNMLIAEARMLGVAVPFPAYIHNHDFAPAARWISGRRSEGRSVLWMGPVSMGVLVASAAMENSIPIDGTTFLCGAEPLTAARRQVMEAAGGNVYPRYGISELGWVGCSCSQMTGGSTVHVMRDSVAVITHRRRAPMSDMEVDSLMFTTLLPISTYVVVNVEMEDCGTLRDATCNCEFRQMGFTQELSDVYSFGKLTGQGITLMGGDLISVLETSLPARFGGTPVDYQLVELEGDSGAIVELRVNPRAGVQSESNVRDFFLSEVRRLWGGSLTARQWGQTGAVRVVFAEPIISGGRKINPLLLLGGNSSRPANGVTASQ
jgi:hypothetical protein